MLRWYTSMASILRSLKCYRLEQQQFAWMRIWCTIWLKRMTQGWPEIPVLLCNSWEFLGITKRDGYYRSPLRWFGTTICQKDDLVQHSPWKMIDLVHNLAKKDDLLQQFAWKMIWCTIWQKRWFGTTVCMKVDLVKQFPNKRWRGTPTCQKDLMQYFAKKTI